MYSHDSHPFLTPFLPTSRNTSSSVPQVFPLLFNSSLLICLPFSSYLFLCPFSFFTFNIYPSHFLSLAFSFSFSLSLLLSFSVALAYFVLSYTYLFSLAISWCLFCFSATLFCYISLLLSHSPPTISLHPSTPFPLFPFWCLSLILSAWCIVHST
jgi:hypothetical protein